MKTSVFLVVLLIPALLGAQVPGCTNCQTADLLNGRAWATLDRAAKIYFLTGIMEGAKAATAALFFTVQGVEGCDNLKGLDALVCATCTTGDLVSELDVFYEVPANRGIPVSFALPVCIKKFKGGTAAEIGEQVERVRRLFNKN